MVTSNSTKKRYFLFYPESKKSNGARALYILHDRLWEKGYEAYFVRDHEPRHPEYKYASAITEYNRKHDIAVYPEVDEGNRLRFQNVVRYVLYYPGQLEHGEKTFHPSEMIFTWSKLYYDAPILWFDTLDHTLFFDEGLPKQQNCYFIHKGGQGRAIEELQGAVEINMTYPETREELAALLKTTDTLYSYDKNSLLVVEALFCGAKVKIITEDGLIDVPKEDYVQRHNEDELMNTFIELTQQMNYTGEIQQCPMALHNFLQAPSKLPKNKKDYAELLQRAIILEKIRAARG